MTRRELLALTPMVTEIAPLLPAQAVVLIVAKLGVDIYSWRLLWLGTADEVAAAIRRAGKPVMQQVNALKPRVAALVARNEKYRTTARYYTFDGTSIGASIWDLLSVLRNFDPRGVGFHYHIVHMTSEGAAGSWVTNLRAIGPWLRGVAVKDDSWERAASGQWSRRAVPLGQGIVRLLQFADRGRAEITQPRDQVVLAMKKIRRRCDKRFARPVGLRTLRWDFGMLRGALLHFESRSQSK